MMMNVAVTKAKVMTMMSQKAAMMRQMTAVMRNTKKR